MNAGIDSTDGASEGAAIPAGRRSSGSRAPQRRAVGRLLAAADATARRHPTAVAAALFCGGLATGTWLARSRRLERAGEASERSGGPLPAASAPAEGEPLLPFTGSVPRGRGVARLRNPVGAPSAMQR
jgi:hypothetical protein